MILKSKAAVATNQASEIDKTLWYPSAGKCSERFGPVIAIFELSKVDEA